MGTDASAGDAGNSDGAAGDAASDAADASGGDAAKLDGGSGASDGSPSDAAGTDAAPWDCAVSGPNGVQVWTCKNGNLHECVNATPVETKCDFGCLPRAAGIDDLCIQAAARPWSCGDSNVSGAQYWTCSAPAGVNASTKGDLFQCSAAGTPEEIFCPEGCSVDYGPYNDTCN
jgi:hypothetical protein